MDSGHTPGHVFTCTRVDLYKRTDPWPAYPSTPISCIPLKKGIRRKQGKEKEKTRGGEGREVVGDGKQEIENRGGEK